MGRRRRITTPPANTTGKRKPSPRNSPGNTPADKLARQRNRSPSPVLSGRSDFPTSSPASLDSSFVCPSTKTADGSESMDGDSDSTICHSIGPANFLSTASAEPCEYNFTKPSTASIPGNPADSIELEVPDSTPAGSTPPETTADGFSPPIYRKRRFRGRLHPATRTLTNQRPFDPDCITVLFRPVATLQGETAASSTSSVAPRPPTSLHQLTMGALARFYKSLTVEPKRHRFIRHGGIAIDFPATCDPVALLAITNVLGIPVFAQLPTTASGSFGIIRFRNHLAPEESVLDGYTSHGENPAIHKITRLGDSQVYKVHFVADLLPPTVLVYYEQFRVLQYFQAPVRCFKCQRFNHIACDCQGRETCSVCGQVGHSYRSCPNAAASPRCANCAGAHQATDRNCPHRLHELQVRQVQVREKIPLIQARVQVAKSYAEATRHKTAVPVANTDKPFHTPACSTLLAAKPPLRGSSAQRPSLVSRPLRGRSAAPLAKEAVQETSIDQEMEPLFVERLLSLVAEFTSGRSTLSDFLVKLISAVTSLNDTISHLTINHGQQI